MTTRRPPIQAPAPATAATWAVIAAMAVILLIVFGALPRLAW